jgi:hypothetical protein
MRAFSRWRVLFHIPVLSLRNMCTARRERPRGRSAAAKQDDEIAPSYT